MADAKAPKKDDKAKSAAKTGDETPEEGAAEGEDQKKRRISGKKLILFIVLPVVVLLGGGATAHFLGLTKALLGGGEEQAEQKPPPPKQAVFYNLPEMLVNLNSPGRKTNFLKISISLELDAPTDIPRIEAVMPRIVDNFQVYLRELRIEDLRGSTGLYRLREELLARVNTSVQPARINDVLFKEMLIQ
ncbi:MAG: flagellar basal body-associated FliL family protein [Rhodospirillales bacterium]|nr:flagellar basal body-associated FliL family protein [Rhodospirillales bacterium]